MPPTPEIEVRAFRELDREWASGLLSTRWGGTRIVSRGCVHEATRLPGFVAWSRGERAGLLTLHVEARKLEVVTLDSLESGRGIGAALLEAAVCEARRLGCRRLWLVTTNDNVAAIRFYERRGLRIAKVHEGAVAEARRLKPGIPEIGAGGVPIRDEVEMERVLESPATGRHGPEA